MIIYTSLVLDNL